MSSEIIFKDIVYAGHSAIFLNAESFSLAIDPWLEGNPLCPDHLKNPDSLDCIVLTHGHSDHAGDIVRLLKHTSAHLIATYELAMILIKEGISESRISPMNKGGTMSYKGVAVSLTHAMHSSSFETTDGSTVYAGEPCGVVIKSGKLSLYHAGDTALFADMVLIRDFYKPDIALLPIGDRFTMGPIEAATAAKVLGARVNIPIHYKTFSLLTGTAEEFISHCEDREIRARELEIGKATPISSLI